MLGFALRHSAVVGWGLKKEGKNFFKTSLTDFTLKRVNWEPKQKRQRWRGEYRKSNRLEQAKKL